VLKKYLPYLFSKISFSFFFLFVVFPRWKQGEITIIKKKKQCTRMMSCWQLLTVDVSLYVAYNNLFFSLLILAIGFSLQLHEDEEFFFLFSPPPPSSSFAFLSRRLLLF